MIEADEPPPLKPVTANEQHANARGVQRRTIEERVEDLGERSAGADGSDTCGQPSDWRFGRLRDGFRSGNCRQFVDNRPNLAGDVLIEAPGKRIQHALKLFVKGQGGVLKLWGPLYTRVKHLQPGNSNGLNNLTDPEGRRTMKFRS
jgi:hypothetical protein